MPHTFDVVCIGNAKIDAFLLIHDANSHFRLNQETNELCVRSGEKIAVDRCDFVLGGNAANVSVGLTRLGLPSAICAEIGDDEFSQKIISTLRKENVQIELLKQSKEKPSSFSMILNFKNERTIFSKHIQRNHDFSFDNLSTKWVYLTSLGEEWKNAYARVGDFVKQTKSLLAFNPGTLQIATGLKSIEKILSITDILFINKEEAAQIMNYELRIMNKEENKKKVKRLLEKLQKLGAKIVVITDGENGSYAMDEKGEMFTQDVIKTKVIEKTGAGDAYSTGFLAAILHGLSIKEAMMWGAVNSASVIEKVGAQAGLLRKEEMRRRLKLI